MEMYWSPSFLGFRVGPVEDPVHLPAEARLRPATGLGGKAGQLPLDRLGHRGQVETGLLKQRPHHPFVLRQEHSEEMGVVHHRIAPRPGQLAGIAEGFLRLYRQSLWSDHHALTCAQSGVPAESRAVSSVEPQNCMRSWQGLYPGTLPVWQQSPMTLHSLLHP